VGAALPLAVTALSPASLPGPTLIAWIVGGSLVFLAALGVTAARVGGAPVLTSAVRVTLWGALAMGITAGAGLLFGAVA
jgi:VIT1/CCC1 family predicted Fe2+/Mn2+ transporter